MNENVSNKIKYFSWVMTLFIVLYHARNIDKYLLKDVFFIDHYVLKSFKCISDFMGHIALVFFFFISAFWIYYNTNSMNDLKRKIIKRIKSLVIPFILWNTIIIILQILLFNYKYNFSLNNIINYYFYSPVIMPFWYIIALVIYLFISPLLIYLKKYKTVCKSLIVFLIVFFILRKYSFIDFHFTIKECWWFNNMLNYIPTYLVGVYFGMFHSKYIVQEIYNNKKITIIGVLLIFEGILLLMFENSMMYILISFLILIGCWFVFKSDFFSDKVKNYFSCSFFIFALHQQILLPIINKIFYFKNANIYILISYKLLQLFLVIIISVFIKYVFKRIFSDEFYSYLMGGRG